MLCAAAWPISSQILLLGAVMLAAAVLGVRVARITHVPRVVSYLVLGVLVRGVLEFMDSGITRPGAADAQVSNVLAAVKSLTLCLILFEIGTTFDKYLLRAAREHIWKLTLCEVTFTSLGVFATTWVALMVAGVTGPARIVTPLLLAIAALATAPSATILVLRQYGAKGPMTDHLLAMTGLNNLISIVLFYIAFVVLAETGAIHTEELPHGLVLGTLLATIGSALIGVVLGLALSVVHVLVTRFESLLAFFGFMLLLTAVSKPLGINSLIICLFMGLAFVNFSIQPDRLRAELGPLTAPLYALFFIIAGYSFDLANLAEVGLLGLLYVVMRVAGKIAGVAVGVRWIGPQHQLSTNLGIGLLCQAGVAIGLGKYLVEHWGHRLEDGTFVPNAGATAVNTIILASVVVFELIGPLLTKRAVVRAGEVKVLTLVSQPSGSLRDVRTLFSRLRRALFPPKPGETGPSANDLTVRHVMRTNIEVLSDSANLTQVLGFVERSRLNHFFVVDADGNLVGTINFPDLRNLVFNPVLARFLKAYDMANTAPPVALADQPLKEVLEMIHEHDVGSLPVIEGEESRRLLGIIEQRDVLRALHVDDDDEEPAH